jgi:hypothetical protein
MSGEPAGAARRRWFAGQASNNDSQGGVMHARLLIAAEILFTASASANAADAPHVARL